MLGRSFSLLGQWAGLKALEGSALEERHGNLLQYTSQENP